MQDLKLVFAEVLILQLVEKILIGILMNVTQVVANPKNAFKAGRKSILLAFSGFFDLSVFECEILNR